MLSDAFLDHLLTVVELGVISLLAYKIMKKQDKGHILSFYTAAMELPVRSNRAHYIPIKVYKLSFWTYTDNYL